MRILDLCAATDSAVANTFFKKRNSQLVTTHEGVQPQLITFWLEEQG